MAVPQSIEWSALSPAARNVVMHMVMRQAAGFDDTENALALQHDPPELRHVRTSRNASGPVRGRFAPC